MISFVWSPGEGLAGRSFTVADSVDSLLEVLRTRPAPTSWAVIHDLEALVALPSVTPTHERPSQDDLSLWP